MQLRAELDVNSICGPSSLLWLEFNVTHRDLAESDVVQRSLKKVDCLNYLERAGSFRAV